MKYFKKVMDIIIKLIIPLVILSLMIGIARLFLDLKLVFENAEISKGFNILVTNILSMFVVIELLRGVIEYFDVQRLKLTLITDAAIVFILREVMIVVYQQDMKPLQIVSLTGLLLVIGCIRTLAIVYSPGKIKETKKDEE